MSPESETSKSYGSNLASSAMPAAIHNETPARIILKGNHGNVLTLAPLETTRPILPETLKEFDLRSPLQRNLLRYVATEPKGRFESVFRSFIGVGFWFAILGVIFTVFTKPSWVVPSLGIGSIVFCIAVLVALLIAKRLAKTVIQIVTQSLTVTFMFVFGIGMPVATVYLFSDRCELFKSHPHFPLLLQGRALQLVFVLAASVLPGLLYFLFDRQWGLDTHVAEFAAVSVILPPKDDLPVLQAEQTSSYAAFCCTCSPKVLCESVSSASWPTGGAERCCFSVNVSWRLDRPTARHKLH